MPDPRAQAVREFWFEGMDADGVVPQETRASWFKTDPAFDDEIRERFGALLKEAESGGLASWESDARDALSLILVLDQFTRNIYRDDARAFAQDPRAQALTLACMQAEFDAGLHLAERHFLYLPLMHAEDQVLQHRSVACYRQLAHEAPPVEQETYDFVLEFAVKHKVLIDRFGRFPHRNEVLGRKSTPEEITFLENEGRGF